MRLIFLSLLLVCLSVGSAFAQKTVTTQGRETLSNKATELTTLFQSSPLLANVTQMQNFTLVKGGNRQQFIQGTGRNSEGNTVLFRAPVTVTKGSGSVTYDFGGSVNAESCTSENCGGCAFSTKGGSCDCSSDSGESRILPVCHYNLVK
jgi:hypothetical protein